MDGSARQELVRVCYCGQISYHVYRCSCEALCSRLRAVLSAEQELGFASKEYFLSSAVLFI